MYPIFLCISDILPGAPSGHTDQECRKISYKKTEIHHILLRTREGNRNQGIKYPLKKNKTTYQDLALQSQEPRHKC